MGFFKKKVTRHYYMLKPIMGQTYTEKTKYGKYGSNYKEPLNAMMTGQFVHSRSNKSSGTDSMRGIIKSANYVHNIPLLRKTAMFKQSQTDSYTISEEKIQAIHGGVLEDMVQDPFNEVAEDYMSYISGGEVNNLKEVFAYIMQRAIQKITFFTTRSGGALTNLVTTPKYYIDDNGDKIFSGSYSYSTTSTYYQEIYWLADIIDTDFVFLGNNTYKVVLNCLYFGYDESQNDYKSVTHNINLDNLPSYFADIFALYDYEDIPYYLMKFEDGRVIFDNKNLTKYHDVIKQSIEFSVEIPLRGLGWINSKDARIIPLARTKLNYQEQPRKKKNRQKKLYEQVQSLSVDADIHSVDCNFFLDLAPFKDPKFRNDRDWQLFLKGVMRYFCRITNIGEWDGETKKKGSIIISCGGFSRVIPNSPLMSVEITKRKVIGKIPPRDKRCWQEIPRGKKAVWLYLLSTIKDEEDENESCYYEYALNYTRFYNGLNRGGENDEREVDIAFNTAILEAVIDYYTDQIELSIANRNANVRPTYQKCSLTYNGSDDYYYRVIGIYNVENPEWSWLRAIAYMCHLKGVKETTLDEDGRYYRWNKLNNDELIAYIGSTSHLGSYAESTVWEALSTGVI